MESEGGGKKDGDTGLWLHVAKEVPDGTETESGLRP